METFRYYKGYGIRYNSFTRTTCVEIDGWIIQVFIRRGSLKGSRMAEKYIDKKIKDA